ncbi:MAG: peptidoglycan-binding domain-containing protein [Terracidiphilus sp.]|jgi:peptidoglycan hydrolase-like protein with peptidoglycan-binding domain
MSINIEAKATRFSRFTAVLLFCAALVAPSAFATNVHRSPTSGQSSTRKLSQSKHRSRRARGQQAIDPERVTQIQQALIREHYLTGEANGRWDATTIAAMQKYQADHSWQTKLMPDSRALLKLGLGPDYSSAINAKGASFTTPSSSSNAPAAQNSGFVAGSGVNQ